MKIKLTDGRKVSRALRVLMALLMLTSAASTASAANGKDTTMVYNEARPLIYEDAWDLWPYVFLNENGEPDGYNVDLLKMIFKELDIPYVVRLKPTLEAQSDLRERKSDLMLRMDASFSRNNASYGQSIVQLFTHSVVTPRSKKIVINSGKDLKDHTIIVHEGSFSHHLIKDHGWAADIVAYDDMQEAIQHVSAEDDGIIIWNTMSLKWLMQKYQTTNLQIEPIELPYGEYKFFSNDHHLLNQLDSVYAQLRANDKLTPIQNKWFYPERTETGIPSWIWDLIVIIAAIAMGIVIYFIIYKVRENKMTREVRMKNQRLGQILKTSHVGLWIYDVEFVKEGPEYYLNIYIDKDGGVGILDCEAVSRELSDKLDEADLISDAYTLVVSSPGLGRTLTKDRHLENSLGEKVEGKLFKPLAEIGGKEFEGILTAWDAETITLELEPAKPAKGRGKKKKTEQEEQVESPESVSIPRKEIAVLRLYLDL